jgi:formylmethanofuran dehydrogenase subunit E
MIMGEDYFDLEERLEDAKNFHGDLCAGITIGTRMTLLGLKAIGIEDPKGKNKKDFLAFVETYRCPADAVLAVAGCQPGKRTLRVLDYGKTAATFVNLKTGKAVRVSMNDREDDKSQEKTREMIEKDPHTKEWALRPVEELFDIREVSVEIRPEHLPGKPLRIVTCCVCGERVMDLRHVQKDGKFYCKPCAEGENYYRPL